MTTITVIGAGTGGYEAAIRAAQLGADKVYIIESGDVGGTCLNRGCIPTKTYWKNAEIANYFSRKDEFGFDFDNFAVDGARMQARKNEVVEELRGGIEFLLGAYPNLELVRGTAKFKSEKEIVVELNEGGTKEIETDYTIVATGSEPFVPPIEGAEIGEGIMTSDEILDIEFIPESMVVIGGGVIGLEFGCIYNELGTEVHVVTNQVLGTADSEISRRLNGFMRRAGMNIVNKAKASKIEKVDGGYTVTAAIGEDKTEEVTGEIVLIATGRRAVVGTVDLDAAGVEYHDWGIPVDENLRTNVESIFAVGDVTEGSIQLAHAASAEGITVAEMIMGHEPEINLDVIPACTFTLPEVAQVGVTEDELKEAKTPYKVSKFNYSANGKALSMGASDGLIKVLASDDLSEIYGVHIVGAHANDLIHEGSVAVANKLPVSDIASMIHAHPTLSEIFMEAVHGLTGSSIHTAPPRRR